MKKKETPASNVKTLISFATATSLTREKTSPDAPVCVEYILRKTDAKYALARREREHCGLSGDFPWVENILLENLSDASAEIILQNGKKLSNWETEDLTPFPVALRLAWTTADANEQEILFPILPQRIEIDFEEKDL